MDLMFEAYLTYESSSQLELNDIPRTKEPVWILGKRYNAMTEVEEIRQDMRSRLWFSYRKGFVPIGDSGLTSDKGWGCMLRCGQMVLSQALIFQKLGREWKWSPTLRDKVYLRILRMFEDRRAAPYSIHQIALTGASEGKQVGDWFGPNTVAQVLRKLTAYDKWNSLTLHVALDNMLFIDEVKNSCAPPVTDTTTLPIAGWKPLVLIIPLRLGLSEFNPTYVAAFKAAFTFQQSLGVIGGKPNHALYFIGCVGNDAIYLDPHTTQSVAFVRYKETEAECKLDATYHCSNPNRMHISQMDPSVAMCFFCRTELEFDNLCQLLSNHLKSTDGIPLIEIYPQRNHVYGGLYSSAASSKSGGSSVPTADSAGSATATTTTNTTSTGGTSLLQDEFVSLSSSSKYHSNVFHANNSDDSDDFELIG